MRFSHAPYFHNSESRTIAEVLQGLTSVGRLNLTSQIFCLHRRSAYRYPEDVG
jgi:hypothetical protein